MEAAALEDNFEEPPGFSYRNGFALPIREQGPQELYGSPTQDGYYEWSPVHLRPATHAETLMHELTDKELDNIRQAISNVNVGQFTDLIGQPPPTDFDLENYEDHVPEPPEAPLPEEHPIYNDSEAESGNHTSRRPSPPGDNVVLFPIPLACPRVVGPPHNKPRSRSPLRTTSDATI